MTAKEKSQLMKELRKNRKDAGLVEFRAWVTPNQKEKLQNFIDAFSDKKIREKV